MNKQFFINKVSIIHNNFYNYKLINEDLNSKYKIQIICPIHGIFELRPTVHYRQGCPKCSHKLKYSNTIDFIRKSKQIHKNKYLYDSVKYINNITKVQIYCKIHNEFFYQKPAHHLNGSGCQKCNIEQQKNTKEKFINIANKKHENKYDYSLVDYINSKMNYPQAKDLCVSRFSDFSNENTSPCFCFKSVVQSLNQTIFYLINLVIVN